MPPGLTLDWVGRLAERERPGDGDAHQCRPPVALGAQRSPTQVKGGIARAPGSVKRDICPMRFPEGQDITWILL
jgi:hypothetical protein